VTHYAGASRFDAQGIVLELRWHPVHAEILDIRLLNNGSFATP
jgi:hypothetical protein